jgi:hypothetical protein
MKLTTIQGNASGISRTISIAGSSSGQGGTTSTTQICMFTISGRSAKMRSGEPIIVNEGDNLLLAGFDSAGTFQVLAYRNLTNGAHGDVGLHGLDYLIIGLAIAAAGIAAIAIAGIGLWQGLVLVACLTAGAFLVRRGILVRRALAMIR